MRLDLDTRQIGDLAGFGLDHRDAFFKTKKRALVSIYRHPDHQFIKKRTGPPYNVQMPQSDRIKGSRVKADAHQAHPYLLGHAQNSIFSVEAQELG